MDYRYEKQFLPPTEERDNQGVLIEVVGEFRTILARYLYFKMDIFNEVLESQELERAESAELMPLLRMITVLDPSMTESYDQIAWDLFREQKEIKKALEITLEGVQRNPKSYQLSFRLAMLFYEAEKYHETRAAATKALQLTTERIETSNCLRLVYWASDKLEDRDTQRSVLKDLRELQPQDSLWVREEARLRELK